MPANAAAGSYTVTVQTVGNPLATSTAALTVVSTMPVSGVAVSPGAASIAANGLFTAPSVPGVYTVTATAAANPAQSAKT